MRDLGPDIRAKLLTSAAVKNICADRIHNSTVPATSLGPYIWIGLSGTDELPALDDEPGMEPFLQLWDVECWAKSFLEAKTVLLAVSALFPLIHATLGSATVQRASVSSHDSNYLFKGYGPSGFDHSLSLNLEIYP